MNIKDKNIVIDTENIIVKKVKYIDTKFIYGKLTYNPKGCPCCGHINEFFNIIKYGSKACKIKLPGISNIPTILFLKKNKDFYAKSAVLLLVLKPIYLVNFLIFLMMLKERLL